MARVTRYIDDLDGAEIQEDQGGPISFSLGDRYYRLDLTQKNQDKLAKALEPFISKAESVPPPTAGPAKPARRGTRVAPAVDLDAVRKWARENGHDVSDRGRIAGRVMEAYEKAKGL